MTTTTKPHLLLSLLLPLLLYSRHSPPAAPRSPRLSQAREPLESLFPASWQQTGQQALLLVLPPSFTKRPPRREGAALPRRPRRALRWFCPEKEKEKHLPLPSSTSWPGSPVAVLLRGPPLLVLLLLLRLLLLPRQPSFAPALLRARRAPRRCSPAPAFRLLLLLVSLPRGSPPRPQRLFLRSPTPLMMPRSRTPLRRCCSQERPWRRGRGRKR